ncbi:MAG TPA: lysophospholipid acyltransferase family protein [Cyclobacteriaceae bacterium]
MYRQKVYSYYVLSTFAGLFLLIFPLFILGIHIPAFYKSALKMNNWWAKTFFRISFLPVDIEWRFKPDKNQAYILCANHFSFFDTPSLGFFPQPFKFIGKHSLVKIPLFGYMFRNYHIAVDRESPKSRYNSMEEARKALKSGFSIAVYPEGGRVSPNPPHLANFKNGAFKLAFEENIPIIPVTIPFNWKIHPKKDDLIISKHLSKVIFHEPQYPEKYKDMVLMKNEVRHIIQGELARYFPEELLHEFKV